MISKELKTELGDKLAEEAINLHTDPRSHSTLVLNPKLSIREVLDRHFTVAPAPGSIPFYTRQASHNIRIDPFLYKTGKPQYKKRGDIHD